MQTPLGTGHIAWHAITAELHTGMLTLAFASVIVRLLGVWIKSESFVWRSLVRLSEPTAYLAGMGGLLSLMASVVTGFAYTWPIEVLLTSSVVLNKVALSALSVTFWTTFVLVRTIYGATLWEEVNLRNLYVILAASGFLTLALAGSTGGHLAGKRSLLDSLLHQLGVNTHLLFVLSEAVTWSLLVAVGIALAVTIGVRWQRAGRRKIR